MKCRLAWQKIESSIRPQDTTHALSNDVLNACLHFLHAPGQHGQLHTNTYTNIYTLTYITNEYLQVHFWPYIRHHWNLCGAVSHVCIIHAAEW